MSWNGIQSLFFKRASAPSFEFEKFHIENFELERFQMGNFMLESCKMLLNFCASYSTEPFQNHSEHNISN